MIELLAKLLLDQLPYGIHSRRKRHMHINLGARVLDDQRLGSISGNGAGLGDFLAVDSEFGAVCRQLERSGCQLQGCGSSCRLKEGGAVKSKDGYSHPVR